MSAVSMLESPAVASVLVTLAAQSILISILGVLAVKYMGRQPAPNRGLVCAGAIAALCMVFVISIGFQLSSIGWYQPDLAGLLTRTSQPLDKSLPNAQLAVSSSVQAPRPAMTNGFESHHTLHMPVKAELVINAVGLIWMTGFLLLLLKLGYGLIFLQGFRFGLVRVADDKFDGLIRTVAGAFRKNRLPELYTSANVESPITIGLLNPIVIIPERLYGTLSENELKSILLHELAHIYHYDHVVGVIKRIVLAAYWWNPLAYRINAEHDLAREEVSDNYVLSELNPKEYSRCLAALAERVSLISSLPAAAGMSGCRFNLVKRVEEILSKKRSLSTRTSLNFRLMTFAASTILTLFIAGLHGQVGTGKTGVATGSLECPQTPSLEAMNLGREGRHLSSEQVAMLEKVVAQNPHDLRSQNLLLSYYFSNRFTDKRQQTIFWLIQNHPRATVLSFPEGELHPTRENYAEGARLWYEQLQQYPNDPAILWNAGKSFMRQDIDLAIDLFNKGKNLDPRNSAVWYRELGHFYELKGFRSPAQESSVLANQALNSYENAQSGTKVEDRSYLLPNMARAALAAGRLDKAAAYANQMLAATGDDWNKGNMIYYGNFVLGMVAVQKGDLQTAEDHLLAAADTPGSPQLNSFGPNMRLAKELLDRGRKDTVLVFLKKCMRFWTLSTSPCSRWIREIEEGQTPDFRTNLDF
jgi:beta-lactamase regulating signal transducer with metallopeptidase domain